MHNNLRSFVNRDFLYTFLNQGWRIISGPLLLLCIPLYLTPLEQGYWYTFIGISALSIFVDMGFMQIVLQFAAHEAVFLKKNSKEKFFTGDKLRLVKISTLFVFSIKWILCAIILVFPIVLIVGIYIFSMQENAVVWLFPWIIYCVASAIVFFYSSIFLFFEGCGFLAEIQGIRVCSAIISSFSTIVCLFLGFQLYSIAIAAVINALSYTILFLFRFLKMGKILFLHGVRNDYNWKKEIIPLLYKYAIGGVGAYFMMQIYTPIVFQYYGAYEAGLVGISISLWSAIHNISTVWIYIITPKINGYIAKADWRKLDYVFFNHLRLSLGTFGLGFVFVFIMLLNFKGSFKIIDRFMSVEAMFLMAICWGLQVMINGFAVYLRAHKEEPFAIPTLLMGLYVTVSTFLCVYYLDIDCIFLGYASSFIVFLPWVLCKFWVKRKSHNDKHNI